MMYEYGEHNKVMGHYASGGGAIVQNSPINITINVYAQDAPTRYSLWRSIHAYVTGTRTIEIENASQLSQEDFQRVLDQRLSDG